MPHGPQKLILIGAGRYDYAEVELSGSLQIVGPNNTGKTTLINTLQFLYLDDRRHMDFGSYTPEQTRDYYFPNQYSYVLFECLGARGQCVLGWRGQSKASGGEPERFTFEGPFDAADFIDEQNQVREPKTVSARLTRKQYTVLKAAQDHRELLLLATKGEGRGRGLVALRDNDKYPQFRETLKNLLSLSTISQDQMRDRLLMLADLSTEKFALDVRELFGEDYDKIVERKRKLIRFKKHQSEVELLVDTCAQRDALRGKLIYCWSDLRAKRQEFEHRHTAKVDKLRAEAQAAAERIQTDDAELTDRRSEERTLSEAKGGLQTRLNELTRQTADFSDFVEELERASLKNVEMEVRRLERQLGDAEKETRAKAEQKIHVYGDLVKQKRQTIAHFDRALVTVLRGDLTDDELAPLARLFNFELLHQGVGDDGIRLHKRDEFVRLLRALSQRVQNSVYRDANVELPLPASQHSLADLVNLDAVRERLADEEEKLKRLEDILKAIAEKETLTTQLHQWRDDETKMRKRLFGWEQFQNAKAEEPRLEVELQRTMDALTATAEGIAKLEKQINTARNNETRARNSIREEENTFSIVMGRFNQCVFPEFPGKPESPDETIPGGFDDAVDLFLRQQKTLTGLDQQVRERFHTIESTFGSDFVGADETETIRLLREELEALPDHEDALRRDWEHQLHQLRAIFHQVLADVSRLHAAATDLNKAFARVRVSNLKTVVMKVEEQADIVGSLRRLANVEQPGLFDDSASLEAALSGFRQKFETNPLLRYTDLFTLRFTVTGEDGKPHHYNDFKHVESHGTTITIKVLFNLLVLRSLLREDASKALLCEVPFFLDEIHSLDATNRHAILVTARKLGFIAITAAPESVSEVDALYFLQPHQGRIVLRHRHRVGVKARALSA
jgi:hypothetical protein